MVQVYIGRKINNIARKDGMLGDKEKDLKTCQPVAHHYTVVRPYKSQTP